jgi:cytochrome P450
MTDWSQRLTVQIMETSLSLPTICLVFTLIIGHFLSKRLTRWRSRRALIRRHGCKEPPELPLDLAVINQKAAKEHKFLETTTQLFNEYGKTYKAKRSGRTIIRTCDPEVFKAVLSTHFENFGMQPIRYEDGKGFFGNGMLVTDGLQWKHSRALIRPVFDIAHVANFDRLSAHVERFMQLIPRDGATIDLYPLLKRLVRTILIELDAQL